MKCVRGNAWPASAVGALKPPPPLMHCGTGPEMPVLPLNGSVCRRCGSARTTSRTTVRAKPRDRVRGRQLLQPQ